MKAWLPTLLALASCAGPSCPPSRYATPVDPRPFLWRVSGPRGRVVLFGTFHAGGKHDVPAAALDALRGAKMFVAERPPIDADRLRALSTLPPGQNLPDLIGADAWTELREALAGRADEDRLRRARPWYAMSLLTAASTDAGETSMDQALYDLAGRRALRVSFLETADQQLAALGDSVSAADLRQAIADRRQMRCAVPELVAAYRAGDGGRLRGELTGEAETRLLDERNARWVPEIEALMADDAFIAVGVSHLVGPGSLPELLAARGHQVTRIP